MQAREPEPWTLGLKLKFRAQILNLDERDSKTPLKLKQILCNVYFSGKRIFSFYQILKDPKTANGQELTGITISKMGFTRIERIIIS